MRYIFSLAFSLPSAFALWVAGVSFVCGFRRFGIEKHQVTGKILGALFFGCWLLVFLLVVIFGERRMSGISTVFVFPLVIGILFWIISLAFGNSTIEEKRPHPVSNKKAIPREAPISLEKLPQKPIHLNSPNSSPISIGGHEVSKKNDEFPYKAELERRAYAYLLKEEKDEATMLQAKVMCDGDTEKADVIYYKLRYQQIVESGEIEKFRKAILAEKPQQIVLRSQPCEVSESDVKNMLMKYNFFHKTLNRQGLFKNIFVDNGNDTVTDKATGLMWEKGGLSYKVTFYEAKLYIAGINEKHHLGYSDWRIPTIEELSSLLVQPSKTGIGLFTGQVFEKEQTVCWSSDSKNKNYVWIVKLNTGDILWSFDGLDYYIKAVRSIT